MPKNTIELTLKDAMFISTLIEIVRAHAEVWPHVETLLRNDHSVNDPASALALLDGKIIGAVAASYERRDEV